MFRSTQAVFVRAVLRFKPFVPFFFKVLSEPVKEEVVRERRHSLEGWAKHSKPWTVGSVAAAHFCQKQE